jgi:ankyrin repeat protein
LHWAVKNGHTVVVKYLLERGADVNSKDDGHVTPLHLACAEENAEIAHMLVENGASIEIKNWEHKTPVDLIEDLNFKSNLKVTFLLQNYIYCLLRKLLTFS